MTDGPYSRLIEKARTPLDDCAEAIFGISGGPDLPDDQDVERGSETRSDLKPHRNAAPRQGQHYRSFVPIVSETGGQPHPGGLTIRKRSRRAFRLAHVRP
jgi:hypothetical protein